MHDSSYVAMKTFRDKYLNALRDKSILDVGSLDINGSYKPLFENAELNWKYTGLDIAPGPNVDIVVQNPAIWDEIDASSYDVIVSGQCMEHVMNLRDWMFNIKRALRPTGIVCLIAPWKFKIHRCPRDYWRILPDGMEYLLEKIARLRVVDVYTHDCNTIGIAKEAVYGKEYCRA